MTLSPILSFISLTLSFIGLIFTIIAYNKKNNHINIISNIVFIIANIIQVINYTNFFRISAIIFIILFSILIYMNIKIIKNRTKPD